MCSAPPLSVENERDLGIATIYPALDAFVNKEEGRDNIGKRKNEAVATGSMLCFRFSQ